MYKSFSRVTFQKSIYRFGIEEKNEKERENEKHKTTIYLWRFLVFGCGNRLRNILILCFYFVHICYLRKIGHKNHSCNNNNRSLECKNVPHAHTNHRDAIFLALTFRLFGFITAHKICFDHNKTQLKWRKIEHRTAQHTERQTKGWKIDNVMVWWCVCAQLLTLLCGLLFWMILRVISHSIASYFREIYKNYINWFLFISISSSTPLVSLHFSVDGGGDGDGGWLPKFTLFNSKNWKLLIKLLHKSDCIALQMSSQYSLFFFMKLKSINHFVSFLLLLSVGVGVVATAADDEKNCFFLLLLLLPLFHHIF